MYLSVCPISFYLYTEIKNKCEYTWIVIFEHFTKVRRTCLPFKSCSVALRILFFLVCTAFIHCSA